MTKPVLIVQGAQWGSEGKGGVAYSLCQRESVKWAVRTGSINAGHTVYHNGKKLVFQQLPTGSALPDINVVIGPGAYVHVDTFIKEVEQANCRDRIFVDGQCGIHLDDYTKEASLENRKLRIGATGKGCAEAIIHKIKDRGLPGPPLLLRDRWDDLFEKPMACDAAYMLTKAYDNGERILLEGTQGELLDFHTGPYPFVTSRQTLAASWVSEAGLSPALDYDVILVARTYPIRVAGNSGPMGKEITWPVLARRMNERLLKFGHPAVVDEGVIEEYEFFLERSINARKVKGSDPNETSLMAPTEAIMAMSDYSQKELYKLFETTTVTKRLRRIAELDVEQLRRTVSKVKPVYLVLTFLNYVFPEIAYTKQIHEEAERYILELQSFIGCPITYVTIGPKPEDMILTPDGF